MILKKTLSVSWQLTANLQFSIWKSHVRVPLQENPKNSQVFRFSVSEKLCSPLTADCWRLIFNYKDATGVTSLQEVPLSIFNSNDPSYSRRDAEYRRVILRPLRLCVRKRRSLPQFLLNFILRQVCLLFHLLRWNTFLSYNLKRWSQSR